MGKIKTLNQDKQQAQEHQFPKMEDGLTDIFQMLEDMFKGQPEVIEYLKGMMKGYALQKCVETGDNLIKIIQGGKQQIAMVDFIPQDLAPKLNVVNDGSEIAPKKNNDD